MQQVVFVAILIVITFVHIIMLHNHNVRTGTVGTFSVTMFLLIAYYDIIPIIMFLNNPEKLLGYELKIHNCSIEQFLIAEFSILLFTFLCWASYRRYNNVSRNDTYIVHTDKLDRVLLLFGTVSCLVGIFAFAIYVGALGGIKAWYNVANIYRSFAYSAKNISYFASIMIIPAKLVVIGPLLLEAVVKKRKSIPLWILQKVSLVIAVLFLIGNSGKTDIILFVLALGIPVAKKFLRHPWRWVVFGICCSLPLVGVLDSFFDYLTTGYWNIENSSIIYILRQFSYPYCDVLHMADIAKEYGLRFGKDFITGILNVIPGLNFEASYIPVSEYFGGVNWKYTGGTPIEIMTFGFQQFHIVGVGLIAYLYGKIVGKLDKVLSVLSYDRNYDVLVTTTTVYIFMYFLNADIYALFSGQFNLLLPAICILYSCRLERQQN